MTNLNDMKARLRELDRLRRAHIRGLQLAAREIKQVVNEAALAGIHIEVPAPARRRRDGQ
jgi:hypothetical protein